MNAWVIDSELVLLLSTILQRPLQAREIEPSLVFMTTLVTILRGVILMDKVVTIEEEERLLETLQSFIGNDRSLKALSNSVLSGVEQHQTFLDPNAIVVLAAPLNPATKLLLIGLGYSISSADGKVDFRERMYLQSLASRLQVDFQHLALLEACFIEPETLSADTLNQTLLLLDPYRLGIFDTVIVQAARYLYQMLSNIQTQA
jgi:uncharacterized tellurite resistance protein B-like protein